MPEVHISGDDFEMQLSVSGYERERVGETYDDDWLRGAVTLEVTQPPTATFTARCAVAWQTTDLHSLQRELQALLDDLTGVATLSTLENQVAVTIRLQAGRGTVEGRVVAHSLATLEFEGVTDQSYLKRTLAELRQVNAEYPFRH